MPASKYLYEVVLACDGFSPGTSDILRGVLTNLGYREQDIGEHCREGKIYLTLYTPNRRKADGIRKRLRQSTLGQVSVSINKLRKNFWMDKWKGEIPVFQLNDCFDVVPVWLKSKYKRSKRIPIFLKTVSAFGTGLHETTNFMSRLILRCRGQFDSFLDIGTGTGFLSIVAGHCGAKTLKAIDLDAQAVSAARINISANGFKFDKIKRADIHEDHHDETWISDFVAANLITHELIKAKRIILRYVRPGRFLAVSGISRENYPRLRKAFKKLPLRCLKVERGARWVAVLYRRGGKSKEQHAKN
jgi:ribosomal protein L11 methyltransferase